jgi:hypothetical protein
LGFDSLGGVWVDSVLLVIGKVKWREIVQGEKEARGNASTWFFGTGDKLQVAEHRFE